MLTILEGAVIAVLGLVIGLTLGVALMIVAILSIHMDQDAIIPEVMIHMKKVFGIMLVVAGVIGIGTIVDNMLHKQEELICFECPLGDKEKQL